MSPGTGSVMGIYNKTKHKNMPNSDLPLPLEIDTEYKLLNKKDKRQVVPISKEHLLFL